jgi:pimeloyl-ACP methyl ester carboxylesterase
VMMMHGRDDRPFPYAQNSLALSAAIPHADVVLVGRCGHSPALEHPQKLLSAAKLLLG